MGGKLQKTTTLRDVAARCGVSAMTVSLALRDSPEVSAKRREQIKNCAAALHYVPNSSARALAHHKRESRYRETIAWLDYGDSSFLATRPLYRLNYEGALKTAADLGYKLEPFYLKDAQWKSVDLNSVLPARGIRGVLFGHKESGSKFHVDLDCARFSCIRIFNFYEDHRLHCVANNTMQMVQISIQKLRSLGYKRIGLAVVKKADETTRNIGSNAYYGYMHTLKARDQIRPYLPEVTDPRALSKWIMKEEPDAIITAGWRIADLRALGWRIPEDLGWISLVCDRDSEAESGILYNGVNVGATAVHELIGQLETNQTGYSGRPKLILVEGEWFEGTTIRDQNSKH